MRRAALLSLSAVALIVLTGCTAPAPEPKPTASTSATPTPTPTAEPIVAPTPAFDVTCDDVAAAMEGLVGAPNTAMIPTLSVVSSPSWYAGPAQYMFQRAGGIACSAGDDQRSWEVSIVPGSQSIVDGARSREGLDPDGIRCDNSYGSGYCVFNRVDGDVLVSGRINDPGLSSDSDEVDSVIRELASAAAATLRDIELVDSDIVGVPCTRFLTAEEMSARVGMDVVLTERFGGWGIPAEVYHVVNGSSICHYNSGSEYEGTAHLTITTLPAGAWAFEQIAGATAVEIDGADAALSSVDPSGRPVLDLRVGSDWIRLTTYEGGALDAGAVAAEVVKNFTVGRPAPQ